MIANVVVVRYGGNVIDSCVFSLLQTTLNEGWQMHDDGNVPAAEHISKHDWSWSVEQAGSWYTVAPAPSLDVVTPTVVAAMVVVVVATVVVVGTKQVPDVAVMSCLSVIAVHSAAVATHEPVIDCGLLAVHQTQFMFCDNDSSIHSWNWLLFIVNFCYRCEKITTLLDKYHRRDKVSQVAVWAKRSS